MTIIHQFSDGSYNVDDGMSSWSETSEGFLRQSQQGLQRARTPQGKYSALMSVVFHEMNIILRDHCNFKFREGIVFECED